MIYAKFSKMKKNIEVRTVAGQTLASVERELYVLREIKTSNQDK